MEFKIYKMRNMVFRDIKKFGETKITKRMIEQNNSFGVGREIWKRTHRKLAKVVLLKLCDGCT
jgi:hypothetical protein